LFPRALDRVLGWLFTAAAFICAAPAVLIFVKGGETQKRFTELAASAPDAGDRGSASLQKLISIEVDRWSELVRSANIQPN
jgi:hypothetical protein